MLSNDLQDHRLKFVSYPRNLSLVDRMVSSPSGTATAEANPNIAHIKCTPAELG